MPQPALDGTWHARIDDNQFFGSRKHVSGANHEQNKHRISSENPDILRKVMIFSASCVCVCVCVCVCGKRRSINLFHAIVKNATVCYLGEYLGPSRTCCLARSRMLRSLGAQLPQDSVLAAWIASTSSPHTEMSMFPN